MPRPNRIVIALLVAAAANGLLWAALVPPWQAPDEPKHFEYMRLISERGRDFAFSTESDAGDPELQQWILRSMDGSDFWWYGHAPGYNAAERRPPERFADAWEFGSHTAFYRSSPAYYALAARLQPADRELGLYAARLLGVALAVFVVGLTALAAKEIFPEDPMVRYGAPGLVAFLPMFAFSQASANSDTLANALAALTCMLAARLVMRGPAPVRGGALLVSALAAVAVKRTALFTLGVVIVAVAAWWLARSRVGQRGLAALVVGLGAASLAISSWWAAGGIERLPAPWLVALNRYVFNEPDQPARIAAYLARPASWPVMGAYVLHVVNGFWGTFGWETVELPRFVYLGLSLAAVAASVSLVRRVRTLSAPQVAALVTLAAAPALVTLGAAVFFVSYLFLPYAPAPQSRYLMAAILPLAVLLSAGASGFVAPERRGRGVSALVSAAAAFDILVLAAVIVPYYYMEGG